MVMLDFTSMSWTLLLKKGTWQNILNFKGDNLLSRKTTKVKNWNDIIKTIQNYEVYTIYFFVSQYQASTTYMLKITLITFKLNILMVSNYIYLVFVFHISSTT